MKPRERVLTAVQHREPDRVFWDLWAAPELKSRLLKHLDLRDEEVLLRRLEDGAV